MDTNYISVSFYSETNDEILSGLSKNIRYS